MDGKRRTPVSPAVAAGEGRSILPEKNLSSIDFRFRLHLHRGEHAQNAQLSLSEISQPNTERKPRKREAKSSDHDGNRGILVTCCGFDMVGP